MEKSPAFKRYEVPHDQGFTTIPNKLILAKDLTDAAKMTLIYLLHNRADWKVYQKKMAQDLGYGREKMQGALKNLEETGYLRRKQTKEGGRFAHYEYEYHYAPIFPKCSQVPVHTVDKSKKITLPVTGFPVPVNQPLPKTNLTSSSKNDNDGNMDALRAKEKKKTMDLPTRFKLSDAQKTSLALLKSAGINSPESTLCWFAKKYSFAKIAGVLEEMKRNRPGNPGGYLRSLLMKGIDPKTANVALNSAFAYDFKESAGWDSLKITKTHVEGLIVKIALSMDTSDFARFLVRMHDEEKRTPAR